MTAALPESRHAATGGHAAETGGEADYCNTYAAYDDLPQSDKELIADLGVVHSAERSQYFVRPEMGSDELSLLRKSPTKTCPIVWTLESGATNRWAPTATVVIGLPVEQSRALLARLRDWAAQPRCVYQHQWQPGDLLIWDKGGSIAPGARVLGQQRSSDAPHDSRGRRAPAVKLGIATPVVTNVSGAALTWEQDATIDDIGRVAETADRLGYHHLTCSEHIVMPASEAGRRGVHIWDPLATWATSRRAPNKSGLSTMTLVLGYHHPLAIVKRYGTLDHVSKGRVVPLSESVRSGRSSICSVHRSTTEEPAATTPCGRCGLRCRPTNRPTRVSSTRLAA